MPNILRQYIRLLIEKKELILEPDENSDTEQEREDEASVAANVAGPMLSLIHI